MTILDFRAIKNAIAVSAAAQETAINTEQTMDQSILCALGDVINLEPRREGNENELNGKEEADTVYDLGNLASGTLNFEKCQPNHAAFVMAYALGTIATAAAGSGYAHTITPLSGDIDSDRSNPTFTAMQRFGNAVLKRRFASMAVDSFSLDASRDSWLKLSAQIKGTGKHTNNVIEESITAKDDATSLTLAANAVEGADAAARLKNVQRIRVELTSGVWTDVVYSAVSDATPAVITITKPGAETTDVTYKVLYVPDEAAWATFPARIAETPLRVSEISLNVGGAWSGSAFAGGRSYSAEVNSLQWQFNNNMQVQFNFGASGAYASRAYRDGRSQTIALDREFRNYIFQQHIDDNDTFGVQMLAEGAEYETGHNYTVKAVWPKCSMLKSPIKVDGKKNAEAGDLMVLEHDTYGSVIVLVKNLQAAYMA